MWTFVQSSGRMLDPTGKLLVIGYSGLGIYKNSPADENVKGQGPIPAGNYTIEAPITSTAHGPYALPLTPDPDNEMFGRSAFLIHGDSFTHFGEASQGCIILARPAREAIWQSDDHRLRVINDLWS